MVYIFRWRCVEQPGVITVSVEAANDRQAGQLAAALVADFAKGRLRELGWEPAAPLIRRERSR